MKLCQCGCGTPVRIATRTDVRCGHVKGQPLRFINGHNFIGSNRGHDNPSWKGDEAGYMAIHNWLRRHASKRGVCSTCGKSGKTDWANISGDYRRDTTDYCELCRSCHRAFDLV